jgi:hypothetical protein
LALQDVEDRGWQYIANDIVSSTYDTFRIVAFKGDISASLPLNDAAILLDKSLAMMSSAAQSIITQRSHFQSKRSNEVNDFLSKLRMGHTERGSFIMTIQVPIAPSFSVNLSLPGIEPSITEEPFERQVTARLCSLISEATTIANSPDENTLTSSVSHGMSANFFEALADMANVCGENGANLDMTWASARPIQSSWNIKNSFCVKKEIVETLREAGRTLKTKIPEKSIEIGGFVIALHRDEGAKRGTIKLDDITAEKHRVISIELNEEDYNKAIEAHKTGKIVMFKGDLIKEHRPILTNVSEMKISGSEDF